MSNRLVIALAALLAACGSSSSSSSSASSSTSGSAGSASTGSSGASTSSSSTGTTGASSTSSGSSSSGTSSSSGSGSTGGGPGTATLDGGLAFAIAGAYELAGTLPDGGPDLTTVGFVLTNQANLCSPTDAGVLGPDGGVLDEYLFVQGQISQPTDVTPGYYSPHFADMTDLTVVGLYDGLRNVDGSYNGPFYDAADGVGFVQLAAVSASRLRGSFQVSLTLQDGGASPLSGSFDVPLCPYLAPL